MKISVIIPVYQVEKYLRQCVDSVIKQSYRNIEIILVDDGARDGSPDICDEYALSDNRIRVIHQENGGLSEARNSGLRVATGDYIAFLDGDDYWDDANALERLVKRVQQTKAQVLNYSYKKYMEDTGEKFAYFQNVPKMPLTCNNKYKQLQYLTQNHLYIASACNKLINRDMFDDSLKFRKGVYSEDIEWCARLLQKAQTLDFICENFYCYRQRRDSIRYTINNKKCVDLCNNIIRCFEMAKESDTEEKEFLYRYIAFQYGTFFMVQAQAETIPYECIKRLKEYQWILKYHVGNKKLICLYAGCKFIGYKNLCKITRLVYRKR